MSMQEYTSVLLIAAILFAGILVASPFSAVAQEEQQQQPQNTTTTTITASAGNTTYIFSSAIIRNKVITATYLSRKHTTWKGDSN
jgi:uncharacterized membrane protein affecting hemolysin expression